MSNHNYLKVSKRKACRRIKELVAKAEEAEAPEGAPDSMAERDRLRRSWIAECMAGVGRILHRGNARALLYTSIQEVNGPYRVWGLCDVIAILQGTLSAIDKGDFGSACHYRRVIICEKLTSLGKRLELKVIVKLSIPVSIWGAYLLARTLMAH